MLEEKFTSKRLRHLQRGKWQIKRRYQRRPRNRYNSASLYRGRPDKLQARKAQQALEHDTLYYEA